MRLLRPVPSRHLITLLSAACIAGLCVPWLAGTLAEARGTLPWLLDLASHWQWLYAIVLFACILSLAVRRRIWLCGLCLLALPWLTASSRLPAAKDPDRSLTIVSANIHYRSTDISRLAAWLAQEQPDVVVVLEVSPAAADALAVLQAYPHRLLAADESPFGIALLSRHPLEAARLVPSHDGIPHVEARIAWQGTRVDLIAFHPMPPLTPYFRHERDRRLLDMARKADPATPALIVGDLNATPWSSGLSALQELGLRRATSAAPTWPSAGLGWFGIPIDHVLASAHWQVAESKVGPLMGSDHLPVLARLSLARPATRR